MLKLILEIGILTAALAIFPPGNNIVHLSKKSVQSVLLPSNNVWIVMFYSPSCGYCHKFAPEYAKASLALKGVVRVGAVNAVEEKELAAWYKITGFPTVKLFVNDKRKSEEFHGERTAIGLVKAAMSAIQRLVNYQLNGKSDKESTINFKNVVKLTKNTFKSIVLNSSDIWMINFYAPWCETCQKFQSVWAEAATKLKGKVKFGAVDISNDIAVAEKYGITTYPTVKYFPFGSKNKIFDYKEPRELVAILKFATKLFTEGLPSPENKQLANYTVFKEACFYKKLCVISFLPHLLDCQSKCRYSHLEMLKRVGEIFKMKPWGWIWSEAGLQGNLETNTEIGGFGYPAMVVINLNKKVYSVLRGAFSEEGITEFLRALSYGRGHVSSLKSEIVLHDTQAWNGEDAVVPSEQEEQGNTEAIEEKPKSTLKNDGICLKEICDQSETQHKDNNSSFKSNESCKRTSFESVSKINMYQKLEQCMVR